MEFKIGLVDKNNIGAFENYLLKTDSSGEDRYIIGLTDTEGSACGAIAGHLSGDSFIVDSFYVAPSVRRQGGGTLLLDTLLESLREEDEELTVRISFAETDEESEALYEFLLALGYAECSVDKAVYLIPAAEIDPNTEIVPEAVPLSKWSDENIRILEKKVLETGIGISKGTLAEANRTVSTVYYKNGREEALLMAMKQEEGFWYILGGIMIENAYDAYKKALAATAVKAYRKMDDDGELMIMAWLDKEKEIIEEMFPGCENLYHSFVIV